MGAIVNIKQLDLNGTYTYADYLTWQFQERLELFRGKISKMSPATNRKHQTVLGDLYTEVRLALKKTTCNVYLAPFDVRLVRTKTKDEKVHTVVQPDLCIVCDEKKLDDKGCLGAPDLVVEILSPGNSAKEMGIKFDLYEENGVKEYWIINPAEKNALVYVNKKGKFIGLKPLTGNDIIKSELLKGLQIKLSEIV